MNRDPFLVRLNAPTERRILKLAPWLTLIAFALGYLIGACQALHR